MNDWTTVTQRENPASSHQHVHISLHLVTYPLPYLLFLVSMDTQHSLLSKVSLSTWALDSVPLSYSGFPCGLHPLSYIVHLSPRLLHPQVHALGISLNSLISLLVSLTHFSTFFQLQTELLSPLPHPHNPLELGSDPYYSTETAVVEVTNVLHVVKSRGHLFILIFFDL